jgi:FtsP/CotA-like multicopper oxidase with cupredoxin domain
MSGTRRRFFQDAAILGTGFLGLARSLRGETDASASQTARQTENGRHQHPYTEKQNVKPAPSHERDPYQPMIAPDIPDLPFEMDGSVKVFRLMAEPVKRKIATWKTIDAWGYNGSCPGPTIQVQQGDRVRVVL